MSLIAECLRGLLNLVFDQDMGCSCFELPARHREASSSIGGSRRLALDPDGK